MRFHELRHTCASLLLAQGVEPRVIMELLGHSMIGTTLDVYAHVLPALTRDAADKMDAVLRRSGSRCEALGSQVGSQTTESGDTAGALPNGRLADLEVGWRAGRDSNPRPSDP